MVCRGVGPSRAGVFVNLIPVSALLLSALVLGESIGGREVAVLRSFWQGCGWSDGSLLGSRVPVGLFECVM